MTEEQILYPLTLDLSTIRMRTVSSNDFHTIDGTESYEPHIHNCYEVYVNVSGDISFLVNNQVYAVRSGSVILTAPGDVHLCIYNSSCKHEHFCLWFSCDPRSPLVRFFHQPEFFHFLTYEGTEKQELFYHFQKLWSVCRTEQEPERTALFLSILLTLGKTKKKQEGNILPALELPEGMQKILDYIDAHFAEIQNVGELAEQFFVSRATVNRWFRKYIHVSPRELVEAKKLAFAKKMLKEGKNITDTSMGSGFSDCSYFISVFKKKFGETPLQYQKKCIKQSLFSSYD